MKKVLVIFLCTPLFLVAQSENYDFDHVAEVRKNSGVKNFMETIVFPDSIQYETFDVFYSYYYEFDTTGKNTLIYGRNIHNDTVYIKTFKYKNRFLIRSEEEYPTMNDYTYATFTYNQEGYETQKAEVINGVLITTNTVYKDDGVSRVSVVVEADGYSYKAKYKEDYQNSIVYTEKYAEGWDRDQCTHIIRRDTSDDIVYECVKGTERWKYGDAKTIRRYKWENIYDYSKGKKDYLMINKDYGMVDSIRYVYNDQGDLISEKTSSWNNYYIQQQYNVLYYTENIGWTDDIFPEMYGKGPWKKVPNLKMEYIDGEVVVNDKWENEVEIRTYTYEYDSHNNWIRKTCYKNGEILRIIERTINYY